MKENKKAKFLFIADSDLKLIDYFDVRNKQIAHPAFVLLNDGKEVWRTIEEVRKRTSVKTLIKKLTELVSDNSKCSIRVPQRQTNNFFQVRKVIVMR